MALSPQDKAFYEEKLGWKSFGYLFAATVIFGAIAWPVLLYVQDWSIGQTGTWTSTVVINLAAKGFLLGMVVSTVMYLIFKFFLEMGWLPRRR
jgi:hypothetical protein